MGGIVRDAGLTVEELKTLLSDRLYNEKQSDRRGRSV